VRLDQMDTIGLSVSGIWVRRMKSASSITDEALSLAQVLQLWNLTHTMQVDEYHTLQAEVCYAHLAPTWIYLVELIGSAAVNEPLVQSHPLSQVAAHEPVRVLAMVHPPDYLVRGALVETERRRRMLWLQSELVPS
jgi:hypothetical protein